MGILSEDASQAGRRERLDRMRSAKDAFTDKIGGKGPTTARMAETNSGVSGGIFGGPGEAAFQQPQKQTPQQFTSAAAPGAPNAPGEGLSKSWRQRVTVKRNTYELDIFCQFPIVGMTPEEKHRTLTFVCVDPDSRGRDTFTIEVPRAFAINSAKITNDDFDNGRCSLTIPASDANCLSWE